MVRTTVTKSESSKELKVLRQRVAELEALENERKRVDKALKESEERLRTMMDASTEGIALHDGGKIIDMNENGARMLGYKRIEIVGKNISDFVAPESLDLVRQNIAENYTQPYEALFKKRDGSIFPVEVRARNITYKRKDIRLVSFRDLTAQRQYKNLLETFVVHAPVSMSIVQNRRFKFVNRQFCRDTGYSEEELLSMDVMQGVYPEDHVLVRNSTIQMLKGERAEPFEFRTINKNGEVHWVLQSVAPITYNGQRASIATYLDITEQTKAELALRESERILKEAQSLGRIGNWEFDLATQQIKWSDEVYRLYERDQALGPPSVEEESQYYAPEQARKLREYALLSVETGKEYNYDLMANLPSGKTLSLNAFVRPIKDEQGQMIKLFGTIQDITERKQVEIDREKLARFPGENPNPIIRVNNDGVILYGNRASELILKVWNRKQGELLPGDLRKRIQSIIKSIKTEIIEVEYKGIIYSLTFTPVIGTDYLNIYGRDITEQKRAEDALKNSEERFRRLAENARDIIFRYRQLPSLGFDYISPAVLRISGYAPEEFYADPLLLFKVVHPDSRSFLKEITSRPQDYLDNQVILRWVCKDGEIIWTEQRSVPIYDKDGKIIANEGIIRDITERKCAEEQLRESEENLQTYLDNAPDGVCLYDLQGVFLYGNIKAEEILGYRQDELIGNSFLNLNILPKQYLVKVGELLALNAQGLPTGPDEFELTRKDGSPTWVEMSTTPIKQREKIIIINFIRDINDRKHAQEALRISEENYRNFMDTSPMGVVVFASNEKILYANQAILDIYGFKNIEELQNTPVKERFTPESYAEYLVRSEKFKSGEVTELSYELSIKRKDGGIRYLQAFRKGIIWGGERQYQLLYNDITERKKVEDAMRESRARFRELARLLPLSVWETNENGIVTYTNEATMRLYGYSRQDATPRSYLENLIPEDRDRAAKNTQRLQQGETLGGIEYRGLKKDGSTFPVLIYASAISRNGKGMGLRGITIDITERKVAEKRLEQAAQEWRTTFDSLTDMVCIIGSDFRISRVNRAYATMLNKEPQELLGKACYETIHKTDCPCHYCPHQQTMETGKPAHEEFFEPTLGLHIEASTSPVFGENGDIKGSILVMRDISARKQMEQQLMLTDRLASVGELASGVAHELNNPLTSVIGFSQLLMEGEIPDNIKEDLSLINSEAQRAAGIVKNLLTFARKHAAVKQATRINNLIEDVLKLRAYEQKVNNIEVVRKYTSDLPEIMVDYFQIQQVFLNLIINAEFFMTEAHHRGTLTISIEKVDHAARISFTDDGLGIPQENLNRIFDPFFTTKEVGKGTGLGLSICHGIITEHGGRIYAESEVGKGATFIIELPIDGH